MGRLRPGWRAAAHRRPDQPPGRRARALRRRRARVTGLTEDRLLGGRVVLRQPAAGYRAATDPVLLAAAVPARAGQSVLDLGCGTGAAALCLAARVPGAALLGLESAPLHARLALENAALNGAALEVIEGDVAAPPPALRRHQVDHAMMNPPWYPAGAAAASPVALRDAAHREGTAGLAVWVDTALARLRPGGTLTVIQRADRVPELIAALGARAGSVALRPLAARAGRPARRVILQAVKGGRGPFRLSWPLVMHAGDAHDGDRDDFTEAAQAILRAGAALAV